MIVEAVARREPQLGLNAMEQPVKHHLLAYIGSLVREHIQGPAEPPQPAPGDGAVRETRKAGWLPLGFRLACGTRSARLVNDHHRTTERHTPPPPRVLLAQPLFSPLLRLSIPIGIALLLTPGQDFLCRFVPDRTIQADVVVILAVARYQTPPIFQRQWRSRHDAPSFEQFVPTFDFSVRLGIV